MSDKSDCRYYQIGGMTIKVESDLPITDSTFKPKFRIFEVAKPGDDLITLHHHFELPKSGWLNSGKEVYRKPPWTIYRSGGKWIYIGFEDCGDEDSWSQKIACFNLDHSEGEIYSNGSALFKEGGLDSLTLFPTDQILLSRLLAERQGFMVHAAGAIIRGQGFLFTGHSEAGKSTTIKMLGSRAEILCDDRIIVRRWPGYFRIYGSWSHGEVPAVSASSAPLLGVFFLKKSQRNSITELKDSQEILSQILACLIKPLGTADWWEKALTEIEVLARQMRFYILEFDKSGRIADDLEQLAQAQ